MAIRRFSRSNRTLPFIKNCKMSSFKGASEDFLPKKCPFLSAYAPIGRCPAFLEYLLQIQPNCSSHRAFKWALGRRRRGGFRFKKVLADSVFIIGFSGNRREKFFLSLLIFSYLVEINDPVEVMKMFIVEIWMVMFSYYQQFNWKEKRAIVYKEMSS